VGTSSRLIGGIGIVGLIINKWITKKRTAEKQDDLERLAQVIEDEYQLAQMEADVLEQQLGRNSPLVQSAFKLRDAFSVWYRDYRTVLSAYDEFQMEKSRLRRIPRPSVFADLV